VNRKKDQPYQRRIRTFDTVFSSSNVPSDDATQCVSLTSIKKRQEQPRRYFAPEKMEQLILSVKEHGVLEPLLVRPLGDGTYELVAGERRYRASLAVGLKEVPVIVRELTDEEALQVALVENLLREDLNPVEETEGILQLLALKLSMPVSEVVPLLYRMQNEAKGKVTRNVTGNEKSEQVQWVFDGLGLMSWESFIRNRLPLRSLPEDVLEVLRQGKLDYTKAIVIARVEHQAQRQSLMEAAIAEGLSLSVIKKRISEWKSARKGEPTDESVKLQRRVDKMMQRVKKQAVWDDPHKQQRLEQILSDLEALLSS